MMQRPRRHGAGIVPARQEIEGIAKQADALCERPVLFQTGGIFICRVEAMLVGTSHGARRSGTGRIPIPCRGVACYALFGDTPPTHARFAGPILATHVVSQIVRRAQEGRSTLRYSARQEPLFHLEIANTVSVRRAGWLQYVNLRLTLPVAGPRHLPGAQF